jgi:hypothetical protein
MPAGLGRSDDEFAVKLWESGEEEFQVVSGEFAAGVLKPPLTSRHSFS